ncbi:hypothetical protein CH333_08590 [candidate division WOR-3 bacterium JGI_Cruoil_03_44_89]|uniref:Uncharacterized protein n=1 Tax=candidate division WOR-3 bacterium JGI_Cruoil_03_44_89 TaxID=1973748 RepID=A0A235BR85_UNCW3|nr:MAG: hypothetical protein CH333_08590 [candidate division WOR-3 bacterium JGI_Cruoil_03_44_89]
MDLLEKIDEIDKTVSKLRKKNERLTEINKQLIEKETRAIQKLKGVMDSINTLLGAQGNPLTNENKAKNI